MFNDPRPGSAHSFHIQCLSTLHWQSINLGSTATAAQSVSCYVAGTGTFRQDLPPLSVLQRGVLCTLVDEGVRKTLF